MEPKPTDDVYLMPDDSSPMELTPENLGKVKYRVLCDRCGENLKKATRCMLKINFGMLKQQAPLGREIV